MNDALEFSPAQRNQLDSDGIRAADRANVFPLHRKVWSSGANAVEGGEFVGG
jgi:hypothetical protein